MVFASIGKPNAKTPAQGQLTPGQHGPLIIRKVMSMGEVAVQKAESFWDEFQKMEDRIMRRAYDIFQGNGSVFGQDLDNWLTAERELIWKPAIELTEKSSHFEVKVAVAGVDPKDLKVEVTTEDLLVKGETRTEKKEEGEVHTSEFQSEEEVSTHKGMR